MITVWKYTLDLEEGLQHERSIPLGATFLNLRMVEIGPGGSMHRVLPKVELWFHLDNSQLHKVDRTFAFVGTGFEVLDHSTYLGTVFPSRDVVLHVWEIFPEELAETPQEYLETVDEPASRSGEMSYDAERVAQFTQAGIPRSH
jgi:hypothetical protein